MALGGRGKELDQRAGGASPRRPRPRSTRASARATSSCWRRRGIGVSRLVLLGTGKAAELKENDWVLLGGSAVGAISARKTKSASIIAEGRR